MPNAPLEGPTLITGGAGFLGRAILRRAEREEWDASFTIFSRDETKQWELRRRYPNVRCVLGDVASWSVSQLAQLIAGHSNVIHAAAIKYVPEAEHNVREAIRVNVEGSRNVGEAAIRAGADLCIGISTDKACAPLNTYGMTKALMERTFGELARIGETRFSTVRYGNVIGSTGSVIPVFQQQLATTGQLTITDEQMTRFWLTADEAVDLILWAAEEALDGVGGWTYIGACPAMRIVDLAQAVAIEAGASLATHYKVTGIRPGEKLSEQLFNVQESPRIELATEGFVLCPAYRLPDDPGPEACYDSNEPRHWLTIDEMREAIRDAATI